ncbi:MAG: hypothetical protein PHE43_01395 [Candidatus Nanoarchaeia archaeon]|nr:hypothetical protein [Candidatus Nanoarchaeia archaeon]
MNKKGELVILSFLVLGMLMFGILAYENSIREIKFVADRESGIIYNLQSNSSICNLQEIKIENHNMELYDNLQEAQGFNLSDTCP